MPSAESKQSGLLPVVAPERYDEQLAGKVAEVKAKLERFNMPPPEVFKSEPQNYRNRAEFRVWHEGDSCYFIMFERREGEKDMARVRMDSYPVGTVLVNQLMSAVMAEVHASELLRKKLYQVNFHTTQSGDAMVTMIYHVPLKQPWIDAAKGLRQRLKDACPALKAELPQLIGRSRKQKAELDRSHVIEWMTVAGRELQYMQNEGAFSQPNSGMCSHMLNWAHSVTAGSSGDLVELYCGNGNFTIALADNFKQVLGTEVSKTSVAAAKHNIEANKIDNVLVGRVSAEEFSEAWKTGKQMKRLEERDLKASYDFSTVLVDPPRAGLDADTVKMVQDFEHIVYISCNPDTLRENLEEITQSYRVEKFAVFDQFPYTHHLEVGVYLSRKAPKRKDAETEAGSGEA